MADISENEEDEMPVQKQPKVVYTHKTRELVDRKHKAESEGESDAEYEETYDQDGLVHYKKRRAEPEEDDFQRQIRLEREEAERKAASKKTKIDPDGTEYEWDDSVKGWFPKLPDQKFIEYQQVYTATTAGAVDQSKAQYAKPLPDTFYLFNGAFFKWDFEKDTWASAEASVYAYIDYLTGIKYEWSVDANEWKPSADQPNKAQAALAMANKTAESNAQTKQPAKKETSESKKEGWFDVNDDKNTNVYVSGLPLDITDEEFEEMMAKYGIIMKDPLTHKLKIKLYRDDVNNEPKGDGRCCYLMPESVKLCLQLLDGCTYKEHKIKVEKAKFEMKGTYDPSKSAMNDPKNKKKLNKSKEKKLIEKQRQRLLDWDDRPEIVREKHEKVVVIKNLFTPASLQGNIILVKKLADDLKSELEAYGLVKKVLVHEHNPEGVATVSFKDVEMADECIQYLHNRVWKNGRIITCEQWDGETKYDMDEDEETRQRRIDDWHRFLEAEDDEDDEEQGESNGGAEIAN